MKKNLFTALLMLAASLSFASCNDDNNDGKVIGFEEFETTLPDAKVFLDEHFGSTNGEFDPTQIRKIEIEKNGDYEIEFSNGTEIDFWGNGVWKKVDMNGKDLPQSIATLVPVKAIDYINSNYPNNKIEEIEKKNLELIEIEIKPADIDILFDLNGVVQKDPGTGGNHQPETGLKVTDLPQTAQDFIATHLSAIAVREVKKDVDEYEVEFNGYEIDFDLNGNFKSMEAEALNNVPESVFNDTKIIPNGNLILDYIKTNHSTMRIEELSKLPSYFVGEYKDGYKVELDGKPDLDLLFNKDGRHIATHKD